MIKKTVQETRFLLNELRLNENDSVKTEDVPSKKEIVKIVNDIASKSGGSLAPYRLTDKPKLKISEKGQQKISKDEKNVDDIVKKLSPDSFKDKLTLKGFLGPHDSRNPSGRDSAIVVLDESGKEYIIPVTGGKLLTNQFLGYGAEWAAYLALGGDKGDMSEDERLKTEFILYPNVVKSFEDRVESMRKALENNLGPLAGYSTKGQPSPKGGSGSIDLIAKRGEEIINIDVKYGGSKRIGSAGSSKEEGTSGHIFREKSRKPYDNDNRTWRYGSRAPKGMVHEPVELSQIQDALEGKDKSKWFKALKSEAEFILGVSSEPSKATKDVIINFLNSRTVKVEMISDKAKTLELTIEEPVRGTTPKDAYKIYVKNKEGERKNVLDVELRLTNDKYTQWHKGEEWEDIFG